MKSPDNTELEIKIKVKTVRCRFMFDVGMRESDTTTVRI